MREGMRLSAQHLKSLAPLRRRAILAVTALESITRFTDEVIEAAVDRLLAHIVKHFAYEEEVLDARHYDDLARHKAAHANLLTLADELRAGVAAGRTTTGELVDFLADKVVAQHLFAADVKFFPLFSDQSPTNVARSTENKTKSPLFTGRSPARTPGAGRMRQTGASPIARS